MINAWLWFHMLAFSKKPLPWYLTILKYLLFAVLVSATWIHGLFRFKR